MDFNNIKNYDQKRGFLEDLNYHVGQIKYFYDELTPNHPHIVHKINLYPTSKHNDLNHLSKNLQISGLSNFQ